MINWQHELQKRNLDLTVSKVPLMAQGTQEPIKGVYALQWTKGDKAQILPNISVGARYTPVQPMGVAETMDTLFDVSKAEEITQLRMLRGVLVGQARLPNPVNVRGSGDLVDKYLTFYQPLDGSGAIKIVPSFIRLFCKNQQAAIGKEARSRIMHTRSAPDRLHMVREVWARAEGIFEQEAERMDRWTRTKLDSDTLDAARCLALGVAVNDEAKRSDLSGAQYAAYHDIAECSRNGRGNNLWGSTTAWAVWNGVTEYFDHYYTRARNHAASQHFGVIAQRKQQVARFLDSVAA